MAIRRATRHRWRMRRIEEAHPTPTESVLSARESLAAFGEYVVGKKPAPHHLEWFPYLRTGRDSECLKFYAGENTDLLAPRGSAKAQPINELVLTPSGWVKMGDLKVGDYVFSRNGNPTQIIGVHPQGVKDSYRVTFTDNSFVECSDDHLWSVRNLAGGNPKEFKTLTLNHIRTKVFVSSSGGSRGTKVKTTYKDAIEAEKPWLDYRGYAKFHIPIVEPVEFPKNDLPIDPYLLGVLIGDGARSKTSVSFSTGDLELIDLVRECLPSGYAVKPKGKHLSNYTISNVITKVYPLKNFVMDGLREVRLFMCGAPEKFIPRNYLHASIEDRIAMLQGLMDTDGTVGSNKNGGGNISFCSTSYQLIKDMIELVQSLGGVATCNQPMRNWYTHNGERRQGRTSWKVGIKLPSHIIPFRLTRKKEKYRPFTKLFATRGIVNIEHVGQTEMQCITVEHPSQLYVTKDYIVTHNSTWAAIIAADIIGHNPHVQMLYLSHSRTIALRQSRLVKRIIESPLYREVFPRVRPGKRWADTDWEIDKVWAGVSSLDSDATFTAAGITGSIVGQRTHIIFGDDLIKSSAAIANESVREKMTYNFFEVVEPTLVPGGRIIDVGTLFRRDDIHKDFKEAGWNVIHTSAITKNEQGNEQTYWDRYKLEMLQSLRDRKPIIFTYQFQNQYPPDDEDVIIKPEWIRYGAVGPDWKFDRIAIGVDLAASEDEASDWTAFVAAGIRTNDKGTKEYWLLDIVKTRVVGNVDKLQLVKQLWESWKDKTFSLVLVPETNAYQRSLLGDFKRVFVEQWGIDEVRVRATPSKGDKHERLNGISGIFENGLVWFNESVGWRDVVSQLTFQDLEHDDCSDATEKALSFLQRRKSADIWGE